MYLQALRLQPGDARTLHAWARLEARLLNWEGLAVLNEKAKLMFPPERMASLVEPSGPGL